MLLTRESRAAEAARQTRIRRVAKEHPDMPLCLLAERFGSSEGAIKNILKSAGIRREHDYLADSHNGIHSKRTRGW